jgi:hypothetical protein
VAAQAEAELATVGQETAVEGSVVVVMVAAGPVEEVLVEEEVEAGEEAPAGHRRGLTEVGVGKATVGELVEAVTAGVVLVAAAKVDLVVARRVELEVATVAP